MEENQTPLVANGKTNASATLSEWMGALTRVDQSKEQAVSSFLLQDWQKVERLKVLHARRGLPIQNYLCLENTSFIRENHELQAYFVNHKN